jgi:hypothetical protein
MELILSKSHYQLNKNIENIAQEKVKTKFFATLYVLVVASCSSGTCNNIFTSFILEVISVNWQG